MKYPERRPGYARGATLALVMAACLLLVPSAAWAAGDKDPEKLFAEGSALIEQGRCSEALPMLEEAQRVDPGIGTQFNIAVCLQQLGRLGSAWRNFEAVAQLARASGKKAREDAAREKLEALRAKVPTLVVRSEEPGDVTVKIDGVVVKRETWGFWPVDPGEHAVEATAPTKQSWSQKVGAPAAGAKLEVVIPKLTVLERTQVVTITETSSKRRTLGYVLGGVGVAGVAAAAVTGVLLLNAKSTADERCTPRCIDAAGRFDQEGADAVSLGQTLLPINAVSWAVAVLGLGAGTYFIVTSPSSTRSTAYVSPGGGGLRVEF